MWAFICLVAAVFGSSDQLKLVVLNDLHLDPDYKMMSPKATKLVHSPIDDLS